MGVVYRARDSAGTELALKTILSSRLAGERDPARLRERFLREARIALQIDHPRVLRSLDAGEVDGALFLTSAILRGGSLRELLRQTAPLAEPEALTALRQSLEGLAELHRMGLVHRDLKPENLLLGVDGGLVVSDLGLARSTEPGATRLTRTGEVFGSPAYMAPELIEGERGVDIRCDLYALGVLYYECLCGEVPFTGRSATAVWRGHLEDPPPDPRGRAPATSQASAELIAGLLAKDPEARPSSPAALLQSLEDGGFPSARPLPSFDDGPESEAPPSELARLRVTVEQGGAPRRLDAYAGNRLQCGRDAAPERGHELSLRLEPQRDYLRENRRISGRHFEISLRDGEAWVEDLGSSHGTRLNGVALAPRSPTPLPRIAELGVAGVLRLQVKVQRQRGRAAAVLLERLNNARERAYALVGDRLAWTPGADGATTVFLEAGPRGLSRLADEAADPRVSCERF